MTRMDMTGSSSSQPIRARAALGLAMACIGLLAVGGCGSSAKPKDTGRPASAAPTPIFPDLPGPCDQHHQDAAIEAAKAAIYRARGQMRLARPEAHFMAYRSHPQVPGQPLAPPTYGWCVSFWMQEQEPSASSTPTKAPLLNGGNGQAPAPPPTIYQREPGHERDLVQNETLEQSATANLQGNRLGPNGVGKNAKPMATQPPPPDALSVPGGAENSGVVKRPLSMPMNKSDSKNDLPKPGPAFQPTQIGVFVAVDGSTALM